MASLKDKLLKSYEQASSRVSQGLNQIRTQARQNPGVRDFFQGFAQTTKPISYPIRGFTAGNTAGLVDLPGPKATTFPQQAAYGAGYIGGMVNPLNPINKFQLFGKIGSLGARPVTAAVNRIAPQATGFIAKKLLPAVGSEVAQSVGYAGAATAAGVAGLRDKYNFTPQNFAADVALGLGLRGAGRGIPRMQLPTKVNMKGVNPEAFKLNPDDLSIMQQWSKLAKKNQPIDNMLNKDVARLVDRYFPGYRNNNNKDLAKLFDYIQQVNDGARNKMRPPVAMGFVDSKGVDDPALDPIVQKIKNKIKLTPEESKYVSGKMTIEQINEVSAGFKPGERVKADTEAFLKMHPELNTRPAPGAKTPTIKQEIPPVSKGLTGQIESRPSFPVSVRSPSSIPEQAGTPPKSAQISNPSAGSIAQVGKSQDPYFNTPKYNVSPQSKEQINRVIQEVKPGIEKLTGKKLSNQQVIERAQVSSKVLKSVIPEEKTLEWESALLKARQKLAASAESGKVDQDYIDTLLTIKTNATDVARKLQSFSIGADPSTTTAKDAILEAVLKVEKDTDKILQAAKGVDFNDYNQAVDFYRKFIKPTKMEYLDVLRYNSMLSSPNTHINNAFSNAVTSSVVAPIEKSLTGTIDFIAAPFRGGKRQAFVMEGPEYAKGYAKNAGKAIHRFVDVIKGVRPTGNLDVREIPLSNDKVTGRIINKLSLPTKLLEGMDQLFTTLAEGGETAALNYRRSKGVKVGNIETQAAENAAYRVFRGELNDPRQGKLLNGIDEFTGKIMALRSSQNPYVAGVSKFVLPFVKTPMNILKQGIEYGPLGLATVKDARDPQEQLAKVIIGSSAAAMTYMLVQSGRSTWAEPTDAKKKAAFRAAGLQPYSLKIGDNWVSYSRLPPQFGFPIALVSAINDARDSKLLNDGDYQHLLAGVAKWGNFFADQSYLKNIGDTIASVKGDPEGMVRTISNYPQQVVPYRALMGWMARLIDPYQRKVNQDAGFWDKQAQQLMTQIPGLSMYVPARMDQFNQPIPNQNKEFNAVSPLRVTTEKPEQKQIYDMLKQKTLMNRNVDQMKSMIEQGQTPKGFEAQAAEDQPNQQAAMDKQQEKIKDQLAKAQLEFSGKEYVEENGKVYYLNENGNAAILDPAFEPQMPKLSGLEEVDKKRVSDFNSDIGKKINDVMLLLDLGKMTEQEANNEILRLKALKEKSGTPRKGKKLISDAQLLDSFEKAFKALHPTNQKRASSGATPTLRTVKLKRQTVRSLR